MKKLYAILCMVLLISILAACGSDPVSPTSDPTPEKVEEPDTNNPFLLADFSISDVLSGTGKVIGAYGYINVKKEQVPDFDTAEFSQYMAEFVSEKVKDSSHNWVSIIFDDGTGFCFGGSNGVAADYGELDAEGCIIKAFGVCMLTSNGGFEYTDFCIREIPDPDFLQEALAPENTFRPAPEEIFSTTAEENGFGDQTFYVTGTITARIDVDDYDTLQLTTDYGDLYVSAVLVDFPDISVGDDITVFFLYTGWALEYEVACSAYIYSE